MPPAFERAQLRTTLIASRLNAGMSSGLRLVTILPSTTASWSRTSAPAFLRSVLIDGQEVMRRPRAFSASTIIHGPWQIAATGLPASKNAFTNATAAGIIRNLSGLITPPGNSSASKSCGRASSSFTSMGSVWPQSVKFQPRTSSPLGETNPCVGACLIERLARFGEFDLFKAIGNENGDLDTLQ